MQKGFKVLILGNGRIARAVYYYLEKSALIKKTAFLKQKQDASECDLLIGALPGDLGALPLSLALKYRKNLIDISDVEPGFYLKKEKEVFKKRISVIPCCGFCPGLLNFILGNELARKEKIGKIEVKAGSLSQIKYYFPFLWCFEDLVLEHRIPSRQIIGGKIKKFSPFAGYRKEFFFGIEAETYFAQSGFENMLGGLKARNFTFRVIRPAGFKEFFSYLESEGFLRKETMPVTKNIVENNVKDNITLAQIHIEQGNKKINWQIASCAKQKEEINSMQKITALAPVALAKALLRQKIKKNGLFFMEELGTDNALFAAVLEENRKEKILLQRQIRKC